MSRQLVISCSSPACSIALRLNGQTLQLQRAKPRQHNRLLLPMVERLLKDAHTNIRSLDAIVCDVGPGALMGARLGVSAAQALAYAVDLPVYAVSSLQSLAYRGRMLAQTSGLGEYTLLPMIDARFGQIYWASYQGAAGSFYECQAASLSSCGDIDASILPSQSARLIGLGSGWNHYAQFGAENLKPHILCADAYLRATDFLGWLDTHPELQPLAPDKLQPLYLRRAV